MEFKKNSKIGIWGYGSTGKSIVNYFLNQGCIIGIMDKRNLTAKEKFFLHDKKIHFYHEKDKSVFFNFHDYIFFSPGVNIGLDYQTHSAKLINELDFFSQTFIKPIIAITGSIGKTSTMHIIQSLLQASSIKICIGGNIGTPTFDLIKNKNHVDYALIETSSFQLEYCQKFAPYLAVLTNFYPNHLDHHKGEDSYLAAKNMILKHQTAGQFSLIPLALRLKITQAPKGHIRSYFTIEKPLHKTLIELTPYEHVYFIEKEMVMCYLRGAAVPIIQLNQSLIEFSFIENILIAAAVCNILKLNMQDLYKIPQLTTLPEHRLEKIASINSIDFYNDSKSTTTESTLAAVKKLKEKRLHLFLGGLSKGVDRTKFIKQLKPLVHFIYCFGQEAIQLHENCIQNNIYSKEFKNLDTAFTYCVQSIKKGDIVLLSPSGSSYDLYENYQQRGRHFKALVCNYQQEFFKKESIL